MIYRCRMIGGPYDLYEMPGKERPDIIHSFLGLPAGWISPLPATAFTGTDAILNDLNRIERYDYRLTMIVKERDRAVAVYAFAGYGCEVHPPFDRPWGNVSA